jgi:hypothetical protein
MNERIAKEIMKKNQCSIPYYAINTTVQQSVTDFDNFPYNRWYRGRFDYSEPVIIDREAGYRPIELCSAKPIDFEDTTPNHCFEGACSVVYPCKPDGTGPFNDKELKIIIGSSR